VRAAALLGLVLLLAACGTSDRRHAAPPKPARHHATHARPQPRRVAGPHDSPVPILEYHVIGTPAPGAPNPGLYVSAASFEAQLGWLAAHGWHPVTIGAVLAYWRRGVALPRKPVALTFDDGYPQDWQTVLPMLRRRRWVANLNLQVGNLVPARVRLLIRAGWEIDAHTFTHPDLTTVGESQLAHEVGGSRDWIRHVFHLPVLAFAYPAGRFDPAVLDAVRAAGFAAAETEDPGWADPHEGLLQLDRFEIQGSGTGPVSSVLAHPS
jgi:peptidoglycan/xylan/chitin deacetylase (PgdA/CDA1 family)